MNSKIFGDDCHWKHVCQQHVAHCCSFTFQLQRPGVEDVAVLKKELVQVQTLMDKMTLERERESEKLKDECKHLQAEQANSEVIVIPKDVCVSFAMIFI